MSRHAGAGLWVSSLVLLATGALFLSEPTAFADNQSQATISALQTQSANDQATIAALQTKLATQTTPIADNTPIPTEPSKPAKSMKVKWTDIGAGISFYDYFADDGFGSVLQLGEFRNTNNHDVAAPNLQFTLFDNGGNIVKVTHISSIYPIIEAGKTTPFQIVVDNVHLGDWTSETFEAFNVDDTAVSCTANLQLENLTEEKTSYSLQIDGSVFNGGDAAVDNILIRVAVYRTDGIYAGLFSDYVQASVPAGKSAKFHAFGSRASFPGVDVMPISEDFTYRIFVGHVPGGGGHYRC